MPRRSSVSAHREAQLAARAAMMRHQPTSSESALWDPIRGKRLGTVFRRQVVIGSAYIANFVAHREKVIIEVDGGYHALHRFQAVDARKDRNPARLGYRVVRLDAELVLHQLPAALQAIREALATGAAAPSARQLTSYAEMPEPRPDDALAERSSSPWPLPSGARASVRDGIGGHECSFAFECTFAR